MIEFRDVNLSYLGREVFSRLSFKAEYSEKIAVLGGSGAGKTSVLMLMVGLIRPDGGSILIDDVDITVLPEPRLRQIRTRFTVVFQEGALFDSMTVKENIAFLFRERGMGEDEIDSRVKNLLRKVGMEETIDLMPDELSGGMQRRVAIARALTAGAPLMILYDEPTSGLDPATAHNVCSLMSELSKGNAPARAGLFIVTHNLRDAVKVSERFLFLRRRIVFDGDFDSLKKSREPEIQTFVRESFVSPP